jgi:hypothetical protein
VYSMHNYVHVELYIKCGPRGTHVVRMKADSSCAEPSGILEFVSAQQAMADGLGALRTSVPTEPETASYTSRTLEILTPSQTE